LCVLVFLLEAAAVSGGGGRKRGVNLVSIKDPIMLRPKLADLAKEAKKIKAVPVKASAARPSGNGEQRPRPGGLAHFRILESPACRRVVLTGPSGRLDAKAAEALLWKVRGGGVVWEREREGLNMPIVFFVYVML
jgi:hypothetical protein